MARWIEIEEETPEFAELARSIFATRKHMTMATLRKDGSPRISATEIHLIDGDYWLGSMPGALKARDLQRDPRVAIHGPTVDPPSGDEAAWLGDVKMAGGAMEADPPEELASRTPDPSGSHFFRLDVTELVVTRLGDPADHLLIQSWHEGRGFNEIRRY